jgi:threonine dehydratase
MNDALPFDVAAEVLRAERRIRPHIRETPLASTGWLETAGARVLCKLENEQHTGAFKVRGALNRVLALTDGERARGVVTASTGNHGAAVAFALSRAGGRGLVFVPEGASPGKLAAIARLGVEIRTHGRDPVETERHARAHAAAHGMTYVSPYNDPLVVAGQGTLGVELLRQCPALDAVLVAVGGGGLIGGVAGHLKSVRPEIAVVGCSPARSRVMLESVRAGRILDLPSEPTISDATYGGVEEGAVTFPLCRDLVDDWVAVPEEEIVAALRDWLDAEGTPIEGAAAVAVAACRRTAARWAGRTVAVVICGGNIDPERLRGALAAG